MMRATLQFTVWMLHLLLLPCTLALHGQESEYFDVLGSGNKEWRLVFRGTAHAGKSMYAAYTDGTGIPAVVDDACKSMDWSKACTSHYRSTDAFEKWSDEPVSEVLLGVVHDGALVKTVTFNGAGSSTTNWFLPDRLVDSCWEDLATSAHNFFSIEGSDPSKRRFFINHKYGGCAVDEGWATVSDKTETSCSWERDGTAPSIKYAPGPKRVRWQSTAAQFADALVIFVRYTPEGGFPDEYFDVLGSGSREWRLVFRGTAHVGTPLYAAYTAGTGVPLVVDKACKSTNWGQTCRSHYRNKEAMDSWSHKDIDEVMLGVVHRGALVKTVVFDGADSTPTDWFSPTRLRRSGWEDLKTQSHNFFSAEGDARHLRRFFVNHQYNSCPKDIGWLVATDKPSPTCPWEQKGQIPIIQYAPGPSRVTWSSDDASSADAMVVFVKYLQVENQTREFFDILGTGQKEWLLAFRGTAHVGKSALSAYKDGTGIPDVVEEACKKADWTRPCSSHYRNANALGVWRDVDKILFGVIDNGVMVKNVIFKGLGTDSMNWFSEQFVLDSDWKDLVARPKNFFSIVGDPKPKRPFFISNKYAGCPNDIAWFVSIEHPTPVCQWEKGEHWPYFRYAAGPTATNTNTPSFRSADAFVVFLKYAN